MTALATAQLPPAFSTRSIRRGMRCGLYDTESSDRLKYIARFSERRAAYERRSEPYDTQDFLLGGEQGAAPKDHESQRRVQLKRDPRDGQLRPIVMELASDDDFEDVESDEEARQRRIASSVHKFERAICKAPVGSAPPEAAVNDDDDDKADDREKKAQPTSAFARRRERRRASVHEISYEELAKPHYNASDIIEFRNSFNYVDSDLSGTINIEEWHVFMSCLNQNLSETEARILFLHIDRDKDGIVSMRELIAIVFQRCKPEQQKLIYHKLLAQNRLEAAQRKRKDTSTNIDHDFVVAK